MGLLENKILSDIEKSRSGVYKDTSENRRLHRVGQRYGAQGNKEVKPEQNSKEEKFLQEITKRAGDILKESGISFKKVTSVMPVGSTYAISYLNKAGSPMISYFSKTGENRSIGVNAPNPSKIIKNIVSGEGSNNDNKEKSENTNNQIQSIRKAKTLLQKQYQEKRDILTTKRDNDTDALSKQLDNDNLSEVEKREINNEIKRLEIEYDKKIDKLNEEENKKWYELEKKEDELIDNKKDNKDEEKKDEVKTEDSEESYTRVKFDDIPNSGKVNLKKYLTGKRKSAVDERWGKISEVSTPNLQKVHDELVKKFNADFESSKKSQRAEDLYSIMRVKNELYKRGTEGEKKDGKNELNNSEKKETLNEVPEEFNSLSDSAKSKVIEEYNKVKNLSNEEKSKITPLSNPYAYIALSRTSKEKKDLISKLKEFGSVYHEQGIEKDNSGISVTYKIGNEYITVSGLKVTTGQKKEKLKSTRLGMTGHKRWYGGGENISNTDNSKEFSIYDTEKVNELISRISKNKF